MSIAQSRNKIIVILGPTASGKTSLSIKLAKKFNRVKCRKAVISPKAKLFNPINGAEIISADSRQVYKGMDIGTGKITKKETMGIPHYLLDVANPKKRFTVAQYQKLALRAIKNIQRKNKIPFLVGGTGFYIQSVVDGTIIPEVKPNWALRKKLSLEPLPLLYKRLAELDPVRAGNIDQNNPRRVIRALEIILTLKGPVPSASSNKPDFEVLILGVNKNQNKLKKLIKKRLLIRLKQGMVTEIKKLHKSGLSYKRLEEFGLEYRFVAQYLQGKLDYDEMVAKLQKEIENYAKRQMTWFKRDKRIHWVKNYKESQKLVKKFIQ